jgi:hypothetical protein
MTTSPYTHPSMPGTAPMVFDLSAALEDAEGRALVLAIHDTSNPRLRNSHPLIGDNRKLNAQVAANVPAIHDILGVSPHGSNHSQVQEDASHR